MSAHANPLRNFLIRAIAVLTIPFATAHARAADAQVQIPNPCSDRESLQLSVEGNQGEDHALRNSRLQKLIARFEGLHPKNGTPASSPIALLSEALFIRRVSAGDSLLQSAGNYALARALDHLGATHAAHTSHQKVLLDGDTSFAKASAFCLEQTLSEHPTYGLGAPEKIHSRLAGLIEKEPSLGEKLGELTLRSAIIAGSTEGSLEAQTKWLTRAEQGDLWALLARGFQASFRKDDVEAARNLEKVVKGPHSELSEEWMDIAKLTLSRSLSALGKHEEAERILHTISKASNLLPETLVAIAWQRLDAGKTKEAVGAALSLQAGTLNRVFAPESILIMSMALNELCHFPKAQQALDLLKRSYGEAAQWLDEGEWRKERLELLATQALATAGKRKSDPGKKSIPRKIETQWLASPVFQESLREKKSWKDDMIALEKIPQRARSEQSRLASEIQALSQKVQKQLADKNRDVPQFRQNLLNLRELLRDEKKLRESAPFGTAVIAKQKQEKTNRDRLLSTRIEKDLQARTLAMKEELQEVARQANLVEVEVQQGGGRDLVLTHARGRQDSVQKPSEKTDPADDRWNWGRRSTASLADGEVWEDELGGFEADLKNRCGGI